MTPKLNVELDRRGFLKCLQWAGSAALWSFTGGIPSSRLLGAETDTAEGADFTFGQISDSHIGFNRPANTDVNRTLRLAVDQINAAIHQPDLILHTGDLTHLARSVEFDTLDQILKGLRQKRSVLRPGRTRYRWRRRQTVSRALRQIDPRQNLAELRPQGRAFRRPQ